MPDKTDDELLQSAMENIAAAQGRTLEDLFYVVYHVKGEFDESALAENRIKIIAIKPDFTSADEVIERLEEEQNDLFFSCEIERDRFPDFDYANTDVASLPVDVTRDILKLTQENIDNRSAFDSYSASVELFELGLKISLVISAILITTSVVALVLGRSTTAIVTFLLALGIPVTYFAIQWLKHGIQRLIYGPEDD